MSAGRNEPRPAAVPDGFCHDVRFYGAEAGISARCRPCSWGIWIDGGHDLADLTELVRQHCGEPVPSADPRLTTAREYLTGVRRRKLGHVQHRDLQREAAELRRQLGHVLDVIAEGEHNAALADRLAEMAASPEAETLAAIRAVVDVADFASPSEAVFALTEIDDILRGGAR